jgi:hypothetical protein
MIRRITDIPIPPTLFKYRDWTNKNHQKLFSNQEIYLARPSDFNDPFDGNIPVRWDLMTYEECLEKNLEIINIQHHDKDQKLVREYAKKVTDDKTMWHPENIAKERPEQLAKWNSIIGILSLSSVPDNILMWSHYSNNHTGFVAGFDVESLLMNNQFDYIERINYQPEYPSISGLSDSTDQFYKKFFYKSELWEYEEEWRVSKNHVDKRIIKIDKQAINQIIIGCCADSKQIKSIIKFSQKHLGSEIPIFKTSKHEEEFKLVLNRIE